MSVDVILGPARTGKSRLARSVGSRKSQYWFGTDELVWMLNETNAGIINDGTDSRKAEGLRPYLLKFLESVEWNHGTVLVEGDAINTKTLDCIRERWAGVAIILVDCKPSIEALTKHGGWLVNESEQTQEQYVAWLKSESTRLMQVATELGIPAFDVSQGGWAEAQDYLLRGQ